MSESSKELVVIHYEHNEKSVTKKAKQTSSTKSEISNGLPKKSDEGKIKKKKEMNPFMIYRKEKLKTRKTNMTMTEFSKEVSISWNKLSEREKMKYQRRYQIKRDQKSQKTVEFVPAATDHNPPTDIDGNEVNCEYFINNNMSHHNPPTDIDGNEVNCEYFINNNMNHMSHDISNTVNYTEFCNEPTGSFDNSFIDNSLSLDNYQSTTYDYPILIDDNQWTLYDSPQSNLIILYYI
ncbi:16046_t:CDS:1 [Funneliformis caledonium]|uniref:16046_t:CDS:1 n=1 Tax=Funneliformis caledonium TaxID=1117310 RepID=A0A9N8VTZ5_9GLOM|nr:16046_t:CDS:1 [Funneliformis caledonium]